jgi:hypothetical protein
MHREQASRPASDHGGIRLGHPEMTGQSELEVAAVRNAR